MKQNQDQKKKTIYRIRVEGLLDSGWSEWLAGLTVTPQEGGETLLIGPIRDQAALHGLLVKIRDMGLSLLSVERVNRPHPGLKESEETT